MYTGCSVRQHGSEPHHACVICASDSSRFSYIIDYEDGMFLQVGLVGEHHLGCIIMQLASPRSRTWSPDVRG